LVVVRQIRRTTFGMGLVSQNYLIKKTDWYLWLFMVLEFKVIKINS